MANKTITSLCYVHNKNDKTTLLCRIADYDPVSSSFIPYVYDPGRDFYENDRDLLYGANYEVLAEEGEIAVFDWFAYLTSENQWRTNVKRNNSVLWCEVLYFSKYESPGALLKCLKYQSISPVKRFDGNHDLVMVSRVAKGINAVYLKKGTVSVKNGYFALADDVVNVPFGTVDTTGATGSCQCRYLLTDQMFLRNPGGFQKKESHAVKEPVEIVRDILQGNISALDTGLLSRKEKQLLRTVITRVTEPTIVDIVCNKLNCSVEDAHKYINKYIDAAKLKLDRQTALSVIEKLVESDVDAVMEMKKTVKEEWISENETLVAEKKKEIDRCADELKTAKEAAEKEKAKAQQAVQAEENRQKKLSKENDELAESVTNLKKLKEDLENEIQERLSRAKDDLAGSMLDHALIMPSIQQQPIVGNAIVPKAFTIDFQEAETEESGVYDSHDVAVTDWTRVCGDEDMSSGLALLALAAFACNRSLLVAGEGAETIAEMLSVSVCGHKPLKLHIRDEADLEELVKEVDLKDHRIICVINGLESGYMVARELMERFRDSRFIFTAMHGESLAMEPESLFSTFMPVLTDYFYNGRHVQEPSTLNCTTELLVLEDSDAEKQAFKEARRTVGKWLKDDFFPPLFKVRFAKLVASMIVLAKKLELGNTVLQTTELELVLTPWLLSMRKTERLKRIIEEDTVLDEYKKKDLLKYIDKGGI